MFQSRMNLLFAKIFVRFKIGFVCMNMYLDLYLYLHLYLPRQAGERAIMVGYSAHNCFSASLRMQSNRLLGGRRCEFACRRCEQLATLHCHRWELENILLLAKSAPEPLPPR